MTHLGPKRSRMRARGTYGRDVTLRGGPQLGCLLVMMGAFFPRLGVLFIWLARPVYFDAALSSALLAIAGIILVPFTTLTYVLVWKPTGLEGSDFLWIGLAFLLDVVGTASSAYRSRDRMPAYRV